MTNDDDVMTTGAAPVRSSDALVERLDDPKTVAALLDLLDALPTLSGSLQLLAGFYANSEHILDNVRESLIEMVGMTAGTAEMVTARKVADLGRQALPVATAVADSGLIDRVAAADLVGSVAASGLVEKLADPELFALLEQLLDIVRAARAEPAGTTHRPGAIGLLRELKDPDVNRGIDFTLRVLAGLGARLAADSTATSTATE